MRINGRLVGGGLAILLLLFLFVAAVNNVVDPPPTAAGVGCTKGETHEYVLDAPAGSNQFGPAITDLSQKGGMDRFDEKTCKSPFFAAVTVAYINDGLNLDAAQVPSRAQKFQDNREEWQKALTEMSSKIASWSVEDDTSTYHTLAATPRGTGWPVLSKASRSIPVGRVLVAHLKDGSERKFRYGCDLQPVEEDFPNVPPIEEVPPCTDCGVTTTVVRSTTTVPKVTTTTVPKVTTTTVPRSTTTTVPKVTTTTVCTSGKCVPPVTAAPPPVTAAPPSGPATTLGSNDSGAGAYNTIPPSEVPVTVAPPASPPPTVSPPTTRVEF